MNGMSSAGVKCAYKLPNIKYWLLKAGFAVIALWLFSLAAPTYASAQSTAKTKPVCSDTTSTESTDNADLVGPSTNSLNTVGSGGPFVGYLGGGGFNTYSAYGVITNAFDYLTMQIIGKPTSTIVATNLDQTRSNIQSSPCVQTVTAK